MIDIKSLAKMLSVSQPELLALSPANDPFGLHQPARRRAAQWFAAIWQQFRFGAGVHVRRVHYRLVSSETPIQRPDGEAYVNTMGCWQFLINASRDARYLRLVPGFVDRRNPTPLTHFAPVQHGAVGVRDNGRQYTWLDEDFPEPPDLGLEGAAYGPGTLVEIWCEKTTINDVLLPLAQQYGANLVTGAGEMSLTAVDLFVERARQAGTPARILYISDHDPAGRSMPVAVARKIEFALDGATDLDIKLNPIVLTEEQCELYRLPRTPIKESEARGARFEERFGAGATELDALEALRPGELARIVRREIERYVDPDAKRDFDAAADEYRAYLREVSLKVQGHFADDIDPLRAEYDDIVQRLADWQERVDPVFSAIKELCRLQIVDDFVPPAPKEPDDPADPLFDSRRAYLDQIAHYRAWQRGEP